MTRKEYATIQRNIGFVEGLVFDYENIRNPVISALGDIDDIIRKEIDGEEDDGTADV